jgi:thioredoxin-like negative regulator of GroEL
VADVTAQGKAKIKARLDKITNGAEKRLMVEFKELNNDQTLDTVMDNVQKALEGAVMDVFEGRTEKAKERLMAVQEKALDFLPPESRDTFVERMGKAWDRFLLYDVGVENKAHP